ncbi:MAG: S-layer homology domain-containing protein, partial [Gemmatimonadales bacterium]|nr:S-layer homology domain-containing protein [Gemmatimonadales bacterium]
MPEDHWAHRYVEYAAQQQVVEGYPEGDYRPESTLDRGQMAAYIARSLVGGDDAV